MTPIVVLLGAIAFAVQRNALRGIRAKACLLTFGLWLPSIIEQATHAPGNMTRIIAFFTSASSPGPPIWTATTAWAAALTSAFTRDFAVAIGLDFQRPAENLPLLWSVGQLILLVVAATWAKRRHEPFAWWLTVMCIVTSVGALLATTRIRDAIKDHEIFWISAVGVLNVAALAGVATSVATRFVDRTQAMRRLAASTSVAACVVAVVVGLIGMRHVLQRSRTIEDHAVDVLTEAIERYMSDAHARRPLFHIEQQMWTIAAGALLLVDKKRMMFAVDDPWTTMFGEAFKANGREDGNLTITGSVRQPVLMTAR
jgi:hypothetical protein